MSKVACNARQAATMNAHKQPKKQNKKQKNKEKFASPKLCVNDFVEGESQRGFEKVYFTEETQQLYPKMMSYMTSKKLRQKLDSISTTNVVFALVRALGFNWKIGSPVYYAYCRLSEQEQNKIRFDCQRLGLFVLMEIQKARTQETAF